MSRYSSRYWVQVKLAGRRQESVAHNGSVMDIVKALYTESIRSRQGSIVIVPEFMIDVAKAPIMAGTPTLRSLVKDDPS